MSNSDEEYTKSHRQVNINPRTRIRKLQDSLQPPSGWEDVMAVFLKLDHEYIVEDSRIPDDYIPREQYVRIVKADYRRTRELYIRRYVKKSISKELYQWIIDQNLVNKRLLNKWLEPGFENLCCLDCIDCACHKPFDKTRKVEKVCSCLCHGCASQYTDGTPVPKTCNPYPE